MRSMDCFDSFGFEEEYNEVWYPYGDFLQKDLIEQQKLHLRDTGINLGESNLKFIYTSEIAEYEDLINKAYGNLRCENWGVSICNEVFYTNKIEGAQTTIARTMAIHNGAAVTNDSERMILNGFNATKYLNLIQSRFLSAEELVKLWEFTVQDVCQNESVRGERWRNGSVSVGAHEGTSPDKLEGCMMSLLGFDKSDYLKDNQLIKAAILHYAFEFIHPFCDGNGRVGRLLMQNLLIMNGYERLKAVSVTKEIDNERPAYDYAFFLSENEYNDCTPFIVFMLRMIYKAILACIG